MHQRQKEAPAKQVFTFVDALLTESESNTKCYDVCETEGFWKYNAGYYITDEQGSIRYVLSQDGTVQNTYQYSAFGEKLFAEETVPNRLRYNAQIEDDLTGLYYLRARYFNPSTGRFTQEDVIYNDGLNLYAYCNSNPVMYCDPSGLAKDLTTWQQYEKDNAGRTRDASYYEDYYKGVGKKDGKIQIIDPETGRVFKYSDSKSRPPYGKTQVQDVWDAYVETNPKSKNYGKVYDEKSGKWLTWDKSKPRQGQWDMGHVDGEEYRMRWQQYIDKKFDSDFDTNEKLFEEWYRKPDNYQPEDCSSNRSDNQKSKKNLCEKK